MMLADVVAASIDVAAVRSRNAKIDRLCALLEGASQPVLEIVVPWLAGELRQGRVGVGYAALSGVRGTAPATATGLSVVDVDAAITALGEIAGKGSKQRRHDALRTLLGLCTEPEQGFVVGLLAGELRQGALAGIMAEAVARAADVPAVAVRRAVMLSGDLVAPALAAFTGGEEALSEFDLVVGRPVQPMLAQTAEDAEDAFSRLTRPRLDAKLDGARIQVHRHGERVQVFTRQLRPVTGAVPEVVEAALALPVSDVVLDGEVIALKPDGRPHPFQVTMRRFGRKLDVPALRRTLPLSTFFFDVLYLDGEALVERPLAERVALMAERVPDAQRVPSAEPTTADDVTTFLQQTLDAGHEGAMAKEADSTYEAGTRGAAWLKLKPAWTLDLVVLAVEWGSGRRKGWLSNLHLGARDEAGGFVMLGKTFKGLTDELLAWQTEQLLAREVRRSQHVVYVRPELVVEIAFNDVQDSPRYPAGLALRFARVKQYRPDKRAEQADTLSTVRAIHEGTARRKA